MTSVPVSFRRAATAATASVVIVGLAAAPAIAAKPRQTAAPTISTTTKSVTNATTATFSFRSTTRGATYTCGLDTTSLTKCSSPQTFSSLKDGSHRFRVQAKAPGFSASAVSSFSWQVDTVAPPAPTVAQLASPSNNAAPKVTVTDSESGVSLRCSLDGVAFTSCTSPVQLNGLSDGIHRFRAEAVDAAGNVSALSNEMTWVVDTTPPPAPLIVLGPPSVSKDNTYSFTFVEAEQAATLTCSVDGGGFAACASPLSGTAPAASSHTFVVRATDAAGNTSQTSYSWKVDASAVPPSISGSGAPAAYTSSTDATFTFTPSPASCSLDGATATSCSSPASFHNLAEGRHTFAVTTGSGATASTVTYTWVVDKTPPPAPVVTGPSGPTASTSATFGVSDAENGVTLTCQVDGGSKSACPGQLVLNNLAQGAHTLVATATDAAGNSSVTSRGWRVDTVRPTAKITVNPALLGASKIAFAEDVTGISSASVTITVSGTTGVVANVFDCRTSANARVDCGVGPVRTAFTRSAGALVPGEHYTISVTANVKDLAGNAAIPTAAAYRAATVQQENSPRAVFGWRPVANSAAYGGNYHVEHLPATTAAIGFSGTSVTWYTMTGPRQGVAKVYVDNVLKATVNNYTPATHWRVARTVSGLASGAHVLKIYVTGTRSRASLGTEVVVDALNAGTLVGNPRWLFGWRHVGNRSAAGGGFSMADLPGAAVSFTFHGTGVAWYTAVSRTQGIARVYVDGVLKATIDNFGTATAFGVKRSIGGLSNANHVLKILVTGTHRAGASGNQVIVDQWAVS